MIFEFIEKHKAAFVAVMSVAMFGIYLGLSSCIGGAARDGETAAPQGEAEAPAASGPQAPQRTPEQAEYVRRYSSEEDSIMKQLAAAPWRGEDGTASLVFSEDGSFTETVPGDGGPEVRRGRIAIASVDPLVPELSQDGSASLKQFVCLLDTGEHEIFHLTRIQDPQAPAPDPALHLSSSALGYRGEYTTSHASRELAVEGVGEEVSDAVDGRTAELRDALVEYVRAYHSSCRAAAWDKTIAMNYDMGTVEIGFALTSALVGQDGSPETEYIKMTYHMDTDSFEGGEAR